MTDLLKFLAACLFYFVLAYAIITILLAVGCEGKAHAQIPADNDDGRVYVPVRTNLPPRRLTKGEREYIWVLRWRKDSEMMCWQGCSWNTERPVGIRTAVKEPTL